MLNFIFKKIIFLKKILTVLFLCFNRVDDPILCVFMCIHRCETLTTFNLSPVASVVSLAAIFFEKNMQTFNTHYFSNFFIINLISLHINSFKSIFVVNNIHKPLFFIELNIIYIYQQFFNIV